MYPRVYVESNNRALRRIASRRRGRINCFGYGANLSSPDRLDRLGHLAPFLDSTDASFLSESKKPVRLRRIRRTGAGRGRLHSTGSFPADTPHRLRGSLTKIITLPSSAHPNPPSRAE